MSDTKFIEFIFTNYGTAGMVLVAVVLFLMKLKMILGPINMLKSGWAWLKAKKSGHSTPRDILMSKLDYWLSFKIPNLKMADPGRQLIFRDILRFKFTCFREYVHTVDAKITEQMTGHEVFHVIVESFNETVDSYEKTAIDHGVPEVVMVKYGEWQLRSYEYTIRAAELIATSNGYGTNLSRLNAIYSLITAMMELTIAEAEKTLTELNGQLTGTEYKGVVCG